MKNLLNFFSKTEKLKTMPRTGWVLRDVKRPETVSEHIFGLAFLSWLLAKKRKLNVKKAILIALFHDLCEVFAGDITPFLYYPYLPKRKKERKKILMKWARLSRTQKHKIGKKKFEKENNALLKLIKPLNPKLKKRIFSIWLEYGKSFSKEGKFVEQLNRIETLIQSFQFFGTKEIDTGTNWWEWVEEIVDDPLLLEFLKVVQKKFYGKVTGRYKGDKELEDILDFILEIGKLKEMERTIWVSVGVKEKIETVASHIFSVTLMAWIFAQTNKKINIKKFIKMALCHELPAVYTGDLITPYNKRPKNQVERNLIFKKLPRLSKKEKEKSFSKDYKKEKKSLEKLVRKLKPSLRKEILELWQEYKIARTPEALFLNEINVLAVLFQALKYKKNDKDLPIDFLWEWTLERCESKSCFCFIDVIKNKFYK